jgi:hypothetical protein
VGTDGTSRNNKRPAGVFEGVQVRKHTVEAHADVPSNVLSNDPSGPEFVHEPTHFRPEVAVIFRAASLPGETERLAWVSAANNVRCSDIRALQCPNVVVNGNVRPVLRQHAPGELFDFTEGDRRHARALKPKTEPANAGEEIQHAHQTHADRSTPHQRATIPAVIPRA